MEPLPQRRGPRSGGPLWASPAVWAVFVATLVAVPVGFVALTGSPRPSPSTTLGSTPLGPVVVAPAFVPSSGVIDLGPLPTGHSVDVAVSLAPRDPSGLAAWTALEYTPGSPEYHHFLSSATIAERYGPSAESYDAAIAYLAGNGLRVQTSPDRLILVATGSPLEVGAAFHTSFEQYRIGSRLVFSHPTAAELPPGLPWSGVVGLGNLSPPHPSILPVPGLARATLASCSTAEPYAPCAISAAYNSSALVSTGVNGSGYRIGVVDTYDGSEDQTTLASDLASFASSFSLSVGRVQYLYPVPTSLNLNTTSTGWGLEEALDLQWSRAMAPGATIDMTFAPDPTAGLYGSVDWLVAHQAVDVISMSWGEPDTGIYNSYAGACLRACNATSDGSYTLLHPVLAEAVAEGIGVFSSSGDCGAADGTDGVATSYPASDPATTGVGGTVLTLKNGSYSSETAWWGNSTGSSSPGCQNQGGSGGGYSPFPRPYWQAGSGVPTTPATRGVPDVALVGGTPVQLVYNGFLTAAEGTSAGTPMWSGFEAIADQKAGKALGTINPALYSIAAGTSAASALHDVTSGWNGYFAGSGWDPVTGLGSPNVGNLVTLLTAGSVLPANLSVSLGVTPRIGSAPLGSTFYVNATGGTGTYPVVDVDFGDGTASLARGGSVNHTYTSSGVYVARATVFDSAANSSVSSPVAVVVGGTSLNVSLTANRFTLPPGQSVTLTAAATGGTSPYRYWFSFGDGTYLDNTTLASVAHVYPLVGDFCTAVVAVDSAHPANGGLSNRVALTVGGGPGRSCGNPQPLIANFTASVVRADLPGDLPFTVSTQGGTPPVSVRYVSDDPYVGACDCGIFHTAGTHVVTAFINDSLNQEVVASLNVTILPALGATFGHSALSGRAPFTATFSAVAVGGDGTNASGTSWAFGDGGTGVGANVSHTWVAPGFYTVVGQLNDSAGGRTSAAFLVDVLSFSSVSAMVLTASVTPAVRVPAGTLVSFAAQANGGIGPYTYRWDLGDGDSAFGANFAQTFAASGCLRNATCPLAISLSAVDSRGSSVATIFSLSDPVQGRFAAATFSDTVGPVSGVTPLHLNGTAVASGLAGLSVGWAFGDGGVASGVAASHTYFTAGNFTLTDSVADPWGDLLIRTHAVAVVGPPRGPPVVLGSANRTAGLAPLLVSLHANATGGTSPYSYAWSFGDGSAGVGGAVNHTYSIAGFYSAVVTVTDSLGSTNSTTIPVTAYSTTAVALVASTDRPSIPVGETVSLTVRATLDCTNLSAPGCVANAVVLRFTYISVGGGPSLPVGSATPGVTGGLVVPLPVPSTPGAYSLNVSVASANFSGSVEVPVSVLAASTGTALLLPYELSPGWVLLAGIVAGVFAAALLGRSVRSGRRPTPSRRPSGPGGRRAG